MRLYLSSYLWGDQPEKLAELIGDGPKHAALITNSADQFPESGIVERFESDQKFLKTMGISSERLDLRNYFDDRHSLDKSFMSKFGLVWVRGANVFVLRRAMKQSGFDKLIVELLRDDEIAYGGYSAGACIMGSTLRGLELVDDAKIAPSGYNPEIVWDGLGLLPYSVAPHYKSDHPESPLIDKAVAYFEQHHMQYKALRDGEVIIVRD